MKTLKLGPWIYYLGEAVGIDPDKCGKWMYFFDDKEFVSKVCEEVVTMNIVGEAKHNDEENGVACFYLDVDDVDSHKKVIEYFLKNNMIKRTKTGRLYNISFKLDNQTRAGEYGSDFKSDLRLANLMDLDTGEWLL